MLGRERPTSPAVIVIGEVVGAIGDVGFLDEQSTGQNETPRSGFAPAPLAQLVADLAT
jgi:hypothetical protein